MYTSTEAQMKSNECTKYPQLANEMHTLTTPYGMTDVNES